ncbi:hypothetical protein ACTFIR_008849 [Dictyostelium discoideum]
MLRIVVKNVNKYLNCSISKNKNLTINRIGLQVKSFYSTTAIDTQTYNSKVIYKLKDGSKKEVQLEYREYKEEEEKEKEKEKEKENENKLKLIDDNLLKNIKEMDIDFDEKLEGLVERAPQIYSDTYVFEDKYKWSVHHNNYLDLLLQPFQTVYKDRILNKLQVLTLAIAHPRKFDFLPTSPLLKAFRWGDLESLRFLFNFIAKREGFKSLDDWYKQDIYSIYNIYQFRRIRNQYSSLNIPSLLTHVYPYHNWDTRKFALNLVVISASTQIIQRILKELGYISKIEPYPIPNPIKPLPISLHHQIMYKNYFVKNKVKNLILLTQNFKLDYFSLYDHLSLYKIDDYSDDQINNNNNNENNENNKNNENDFVMRKKLIKLKEDFEKNPYKVDKEKVYAIDFNNNRPYLVYDSITRSINFICFFHPYLKPWLFKYQDLESEREYSQYMIKEIEERFKIVEPSQWYDLKYSKELEQLLPTNWHYCLNFIQYLNIKYPSFDFQSNKFKDQKIFEKFYYTATTRLIKSVLDEFLLSNDFKEISDLWGYSSVELTLAERLRTELKGLPFRLTHLAQLFPFVHPERNFGSPKQAIHKGCLIEMVSRENLSMEDLYKLDRINALKKENLIQSTIRSVFPDYDWITLKFPIKSNPKTNFMKNKIAIQYYDYLVKKYSFTHPLDLISVISTIDSTSIDGLANKRLIEFGLFNHIAKSIGIKNFPIVTSLPFNDSMINSYFRKILNLTDEEDIGININRFTVFSELLKKQVKK